MIVGGRSERNDLSVVHAICDAQQYEGLATAA
jgi:hypothetical protein